MPWLSGEGLTGRAWEEEDAVAGVVAVEVVVLEVAVETEGRGVVELVEEVEVVRLCGFCLLLVDEPLPVRARGDSVGGVFLERTVGDGWPWVLVVRWRDAPPP